MTPLLPVGLCATCRTMIYVPKFSSPPAAARCACTLVVAEPVQTADQIFDFEVAEAVETFRVELATTSTTEALLRMHAFISMASSAYAEGDGKLFISGLVSAAAIAKLLSETVDETVDEEDDESVPFEVVQASGDP